ncbi:MAG: hypothetical protein ACYC40_03705 [Patescibacteria group bacterium]
MKIFEGQYNFQDELDKTLEKNPAENPAENTSDYYADLAKKNAETIIQRIKDEIAAEETEPKKIIPEEGAAKIENNDDRDKPSDEYYGRFNKFRK